MKLVKKTLALLLSMLFVFGLSACGGKLGELSYDFTESDTTISYTFFSSNWQDFEGKENDRIIKHLEEKFNMKIKITGASAASWEARLTTEIAENKTPDLFFSLPNSSVYTDYIKKQVITDINPYIEEADAKNLKAILATEDYKDSTLINGKNYFVPQSVGYTTRMILVRKDWMAEWNTDTVANGGRGFAEAQQFLEPKTLSEFTSMLTYFRKGDPDKDNKNNTYGLSLSNNFDYLQDFFATFGIQTDFYKDENGSFKLSADHPNYAKMLNWFAKGNDEGYIYPDFFTLTESEALQTFYEGRCGAIVSSGDLLLDGLVNQIEILNPNKDYKDLLTLITPPDSDDGMYKGSFKGWPFFWGGWSISSDAKEPMRLLRMLDYLFSPEGQKMMVYGLEGVHYDVVNDKIVPNFEERLADGRTTFSYPIFANTSEPAGRYAIGYQMNPCPYIISENKLVINYPYDTSRDPEMMKKAYELTYKTTPNFSGLSKIIADPDTNDNCKKVFDAVETYSLNVISGKSQEKAYADMQQTLSSGKKLSSVLAYMNK